mgnify:CR=1 FL=1
MRTTKFFMFGGALYLVIVSAVPGAYGQPSTRALFVANNGNLEGSVTAFVVNPDGTLTFVNRIITGTRPNTQVPCPGCNPYEIAISPGGRYLATGHASSNDPIEQISIFTVAPDASIQQVGAFLVPGTPMDLEWITDSLLIATRTDTYEVALFEFTPTPPTLTEVFVTQVGTFSTYLAVHPSRQYVYVNDSGSARLLRAYRVEPNNTLTLIDTEPTGSNYGLELAVSHDGTRLYATGGITQVILGFEIMPDGTLKPMYGSPFPAFGNSPADVAFSSDDRYLIVGHGTDATVRTASINPANGQLTPTGYLFDVGLQGTLGDIQVLDDLFFVTDNSRALDDTWGVYSFTLHPDGSFTQNGPITLTEGITPNSMAVWKPRFLVGDMNCDGQVNFGDINPFVLALTNPAGYQAAFPNCNIMNADINGDGYVNFGDINPFVRLLTQP